MAPPFSQSHSCPPLVPRRTFSKSRPCLPRRGPRRQTYPHPRAPPFSCSASVTSVAGIPRGCTSAGGGGGVGGAGGRGVPPFPHPRWPHSRRRPLQISVKSVQLCATLPRAESKDLEFGGFLCRLFFKYKKTALAPGFLCQSRSFVGYKGDTVGRKRPHFGCTTSQTGLPREDQSYQEGYLEGGVRVSS